MSKLKGLIKSRRMRRKNQNNSIDSLKDDFLEENACYVLITCGKPTADGRMHVEMSYEGDQVLASYLLESAQGLMQEQLEIS